MMRIRNCIKKRLATKPCVRGPSRIYEQKSSNSSIYCNKDGGDVYHPLDARTNVKKSDYIYKNGRTQDQFKKSVLHLNDLDVIWDKHKSA